MLTFREILDKIEEWIESVFDTNDLTSVDLTEALDKKAEGTGLNWRQSIVDFLKLIDVDSSKEARAELAEELGVPGDTGEAKHNEALRKAVFEELRKNGGNVPTALM